MCGRCEGEPYKGVKSLFDGDLQAKGQFDDRGDWKVISPRVAVYVGESDFINEERPLVRVCDVGIQTITIDERTALKALSVEIKRPIFGKP